MDRIGGKVRSRSELQWQGTELRDGHPGVGAGVGVASPRPAVGRPVSRVKGSKLQESLRGPHAPSPSTDENLPGKRRMQEPFPSPPLSLPHALAPLLQSQGLPAIRAGHGVCRKWGSDRVLRTDEKVVPLPYRRIATYLHYQNNAIGGSILFCAHARLRPGTAFYFIRFPRREASTDNPKIFYGIKKKKKKRVGKKVTDFSWCPLR